MKGKCLILGGAGFIGANLVGSLLKSGYDVRIFDIVGFSRKNIDEFIDDIDIFEGNFNGLDLKFLQYDFVKDDKAYVLTFSAKRNEFENYQKGTQKVMNSFKLQ